MTVQMAVLLPQQQGYAGGHEPGRQQERRGEALPQHQQRKQRTHKRRCGKQHRLTGRPEIAQGEQIQPNRDAVAKGADHQQGEADPDGREGMLKQ